MPNPTCTFDLENTGPNGMRLFLEPEGMEFFVPPGKLVKVSFFGADDPVVMRCGVDPSGSQTISFWPKSGQYQLLCDGQDVWDLA